MGSLLKQWLNFDNFITIRILKVVYVAVTALIAVGMALGVVAALVGCGVALKGDSIQGALASLFGLVLYLVGGVLGAVVWRIYCEILIVAFKINENLQAIRDLKLP